MKINKTSLILLSLTMCMEFLLSGCTLPHMGPSANSVREAAQKEDSPISIVIIDRKVTEILNRRNENETFADVFGNVKPNVYKVNYGDSIDLIIWERAPSLLFGSKEFNTEDNSVNLQKLPTQVVEDDGMLFVPYIGMFPVVGKTVRDIEAAILKKLAGKANDAQILLQVKNRPSDQVTVLGDVNSSKNISLTPKGERILDAVSLASGVSNSLNKTMISMSRNGKTVDMPLESVIRNPEQNIYLNASDVIVAMYQPWSYTVMGATGKNQEINFEATGISLIEALARAGGISDSMADPRGVFVFRFEDQDTYKNLIEGITVTNKSGENVTSTDEKIKSQFKLADIQGKVPVIYEIDFEQPESFFRSQNFRIKNGDVIFVASASGYELSKFLRMLGLIVNPAISWGNSINKMAE